MEYRTIVADPPWPYADAGSPQTSTLSRTVKRDGSIAVGVQTAYLPMAISDICALQPPADTDAHLYLWTHLYRSSCASSGTSCVSIKYFTAKVKDRPHNPGQQAQQWEYLRALKTLPKVEIIYGRFLSRKATRLLTNPPKRRKKGDIGLREVWVHEEKGSDVNLASHLLVDGSRARYDLAVVISNDSDLKTPVEIVREVYDAGVGIINPHSVRSYALSPHKIPAKSFYQELQPRRLRKAQLPLDLSDEEGPIRCPKGWTPPQK